MFAVAVTLPLLIALLTFVGQTRYGKAMRATAQDPDAARLMGINVDRTIALTFLHRRPAGRRGGADLRALQRHRPVQQGFTAGLIAFTAAVMGGIGNLKGAVVGGLIIGVVQSISDDHYGQQWTEAVVFGDPHPDHGLPARRAVRRGGPARMSGAKSRAPALRSSLANVRGLLPRWAWILIFLGLAVAYPYIIPNLLGGSAGDDLLDASVNTLGYIIMALGLNIVVGFAGLLDLGYVAFFAIGAFVIGWLRRGSSSTSTSTSSPTCRRSLPGIHINFVIVVIVAAAFTGAVGVILGAPTLRLRGDYLAIVTLGVRRDRPARVRRTRSHSISNGRQGITPIDRVDLPGVGRAELPRIELTGHATTWSSAWSS